MPDMPDSPVIAGVADLPKFYFAEGSAFRLVANIDADLPLSGKFVSFGTRARSGTVRRIFSTDSGESNLTISSQAITLNVGTGDETVPAFSGGWTLADVQSKGETEYWIDISATEGGDVILRLQGQADWVAAGSEIANSSATVTTPEIDVTITSGAVSVTASVVGGEVGVPAGGSTGQVLRKLSATDYATEWATVSGTGDVVSPASSTDNAIVRFDGTGGTSIQNSGITVADGASGTLSGSNSGDVTLAGALDYLTISGQAITRGAIDLATDVTGTLPVANGGTGQTSLGAINAADFGSGAATDNYVLTADGAGGTTWEAASGAGLGTVTSVAVSGSDGIQVDSGSPITSSGTIAIGIDASALKTHLSLGNVENTALSTWAGSTSITTIGTIATGTVPLANVSGTGDAAAKNTGSTAGTVCAGDDSRLSDARTPTSHVHGNLSNAGAIGSTSGLPIKTGTSGVLEAGAFGTGSGQFAQGNDSRFHDVVTLAGTPDYITLSGQVLTRGQIDLTADVTGILPHGNLGTGGGGSTKFLREDGTFQTISGGGDALVADPLSQFAATTSSQLAGVISDETGTGALVFATSPTLVTPALGTPSSGTLTNCTGLPNAAVVGLGGAALLSVGTTAGTVAAGDRVYDAGVITYTPTTSADWDGSTDPGNADDALDQLAERMKDVEDAGAGHDALTLSATLTDILSLTGQELSADDLGADKLWFWDDSAGAMKPLTVGTGLTITGATITAISGSNPTGFVVATKGGSSQSVGSGGYGQVTFSTEVTDIDGDFASSSLTVASDEVWIISGVITVESINTGALHQIALYKDGSFYLNLNIIGSWGSPEIALPFYVVVDSSGDYDIRFTTSGLDSRTINGDAQKTFIKCIRIR